MIQCDGFKLWFESNPMDVLRAMRAGSGLDTGPQSQFDKEMGGAKPVELPAQVTDALRIGFQQGTMVPDWLIRSLDLRGSNKSFVADGTMNAIGDSYPFIGERRLGQAVAGGAIRFKQGYNLHRFLVQLGDKQAAEDKLRQDLTQTPMPGKRLFGLKQ